MAFEGAILGELKNITKKLNIINDNIVAGQAPTQGDCLGTAVFFDALKQIEDKINERLMAKTGWGRNEIKVLISECFYGE